jgi:hypothetical protein
VREVRRRRGVQAWKNGRTIGKYRRQYVYACPRCATEVTPFYYAALNALDFSLAAERIGDRSKPLKPRTMDRIRFGLEKYGNRTLVVNVKQGERDSSRAWPAGRASSARCRRGTTTSACAAAPFSSRCANGGGDDAPGAWARRRRCDGARRRQQSRARAAGFLVETTQTHAARSARARSIEPMPTQSAQQTSALVMAPFLVTAGSNESSASSLDPMPTQTATERLSVISPFLVKLRGTEHRTSRGARRARMIQSTPCARARTISIRLIVTNRENNAPKGLDEPLTPMNTGNHHMLVQGAAQISMRDANAMRVAPLDRELMTQGCAPQQALIRRRRSSSATTAATRRRRPTRPSRASRPSIGTVSCHPSCASRTATSACCSRTRSARRWRSRPTTPSAATSATR